MSQEDPISTAIFNKAEEQRARIEEGDGDALLDAVSALVFHHAPDWLRKAWYETYLRWRSFECSSLNEAFNTPARSRSKLKGLNQATNYLIIWQVVTDLMDEGYKLSSDMASETWGEAAKRLNRLHIDIPPGQVKKIYYGYSKPLIVDESKRLLGK